MPNGSSRTRLQKLLISIRSSLWFLPAVVIFVLSGSAMLLIEADKRFGENLHQWWPRLFSTGVEGARSMLSAIAGSMATITGVAFSITIVALVLASTQYTSRVLRTFMRDRATQWVLGVFAGVYIYCLLILRSLSTGGDTFAPPLAVLGGFVLAVISVGVFIFFIHHISSSIQASEITAAITRETLDVINHVFPDRCSAKEEEDPPAIIKQLEWQPILAHEMGYIQTIDIRAMVALAREHDVILKMECGVGDFVAPCLPLLSFAGPVGFGEIASRALEQLYAIDTNRTIEQDPGFGIRQLVDIAMKALSPGINDTTTAGTCIQHLSAVLMHVAQRRPPSMLRCDEQGNLRVITSAPCFDQLVALSFNQILENAEGNTDILAKLLSAIEQIASVTTLTTRRDLLKQWVETIGEVAQRSAKSGYAADQLQTHIASAREILEKR